MEHAEIETELRRCRSLPHGRTRTQRLETAAAAARSGTDRGLEGSVLLELARSYMYAGERDLSPVAYGRLLGIYDANPAELGHLTHSLHWQLKWMTSDLIWNPAVGLPTVDRWLDELENRYRQRGYSARPVLSLRADMACALGDHTEAIRFRDAALAAERDGMSDCDACERNSWGVISEAAGDDAAALEHWKPVLDGERTCAEEPHRVLAKALLPMLRTGRIAAARSAHLTGYPLVRHNIELRASVGHHIEFCALTGNEARGLEILAEHSGWIAEQAADIANRLSFITGASVLLRRLSALDMGELPIGAGTVASALAELEPEIEQLTRRYDARNGTDEFSRRVTARLTRQPLVELLPLGLRRRLPVEAPLPAATAAGGSAAVARVSAPSGDEEPPAEVVDRSAEATRLIEAATARLHTDAAAAETQLRRAMAVGTGALPREDLARLNSLLVSALAGQQGRELDLADAALYAAARWSGLSDADAAHHSCVAARAFHRAGQHGPAAALFEQVVSDPDLGYPATELAVIGAQYGTSLSELRRYADAAHQYVSAAMLIEKVPGYDELRAELAGSAAQALARAGRSGEARAAYLRAADLWGGLGKIAARAECLRRIAWMQTWDDDADSAAPAWQATMDALVAELTAAAGEEGATDVDAELEITRSQLAEMGEEFRTEEPDDR
ncbi:hypothetical protein [Nocardia cyriacigeorgica]|uniref:Tetratricopeptide repeat protein n=1 Tax=Nocardia cyriacigeorgica TaxID=135487 RepID=A0A6P1D5Y5_9NOCA|nr:hypothetical protein [Nocardia cyriacigeorgica]NEW46055.1 hypothetical protein [Nocardia cyriacigeorgica]